MRVLVLDDNQSLRLGLKHQLETPYPTGSAGSGHQVEVAGNLSKAIEIVDQTKIDVAFLDLDLGQGHKVGGGIEFLRYLRKHHPTVVPIMITGLEDEATIVECLRLGAADYIMKPFEERIVHQLMLKAIAHQRIFQSNRALREQAGKNAPTSVTLKTRSPRFQAVIDLAERLRGKNAHIFIGGESGVGKGVMARYLWSLEDDEHRPFVTVHCGAIAPNLVESELFGHVKGAFTDARSDRIGKFRAADGGDIFLDEIGTTPIEVQIKLLRVLQEKVVEPVGGDERAARKVEVRVISATNANLGELVREGKFREDLKYRLGVVHLEIPPLRERMEDLEDLVDQFLRQGAHMNKTLDRSAWDLCRAHRWPGNVRELEHAILAAAELADGDLIQAKDIRPFLEEINAETPAADAAPKGLAGPGPYGLGDPELSGHFEELAENFEKAMIRYALDKAGSTVEAARFLGISRSKLNHKRRAWGWGDGDKA